STPTPSSLGMTLHTTLFRRVADLEATDAVAGEHQDGGGEDHDAERGGPCGDGFGDDRQQGKNTLSGDVHRREMPQVEGDAQFLHQRRDHWVDGFPAKENDGGNDRVLEHHAERKEDRAVAEAGKYGDPE